MIKKLDELKSWFIRAELVEYASAVGRLHKHAGKKESKRAKGLNFQFIYNKLFPESPSLTEEQRAEIRQELETAEVLPISKEKLGVISNIKIETYDQDDFKLSEKLTADEKALIIIGAVATNNESTLNEVRDWLKSEDINPAEKSLAALLFVGGFDIKDKNWSDMGWISDGFKVIDRLQSDWHRSGMEEDTSDYKTNNVIHQFDDGWKVVHVPAAGEVDTYMDMPNTSHDRVTEGNILGLCIGGKTKYFQDDSQGIIYSIRTPDNKPKVTMRIGNNTLYEAKGKNNLSPEVYPAKRAKEFFELLDSGSLSVSGATGDSFSYKNNFDYNGFPPLTREDAEESFQADKDEFVRRGYHLFWMKKIPEVKEEIIRLIDVNPEILIESGTHKKYFELMEPVAKKAAEDYNEAPTLASPSKSPSYYSKYPDFFRYPESEIWKTYRSKEWTQKAISLLVRYDPARYIQLGVFKHDRSLRENSENNKKSLSVAIGASLRDIAKNGNADNIRTLINDLKATFPNSIEGGLLFLAEEGPSVFLKEQLYTDYPEVGKVAIKSINIGTLLQIIKKYKTLRDLYSNEIIDIVSAAANDHPILFVESDGMSIYPELFETALRNAALNNPKIFFQEYHWFDILTRTVIPDFPDLLDVIMKSIIAKEPEYLFHQNSVLGYGNSIVTRWPQYLKDASRSIIYRGEYQLFLNHKLALKFPELTKEFLEEIVKVGIEGASDRDERDNNIIIMFRSGAAASFPEIASAYVERIIEIAPSNYFKFGNADAFPDHLDDALRSLSIKQPAFFLKRIKDLVEGKREDETLTAEDVSRYSQLLHQLFINMAENQPTEIFVNGYSNKDSKIYSLGLALDPGLYLSLASYNIAKTKPWLIVRNTNQEVYAQFDNNYLEFAFYSYANESPSHFLYDIKFSKDRGRDALFERNLPVAAHGLVKQGEFREFFQHNKKHDFIEKFPNLAKKAASGLIALRPHDFFLYNIHKHFPEIGKEEARNVSSANFFSMEMGEAYPELIRENLVKMMENDYSAFFKNDMYMEYPEYLIEAGMQVATIKPEKIFSDYSISNILSHRLNKKDYYQVIYKAALNMALEDPEGYMKYARSFFPSLEHFAAKKLEEENSLLFFTYRLQTDHPEEAERIALSLINTNPKEFFSLSLQEYFPKMGEGAAEDLFKENEDLFFKYNLHLTYPGISMERAAEMISSGNSRMFFTLRLAEAYPEMGMEAAKLIFDRFGFQKLISMNIDLAYPKLIKKKALEQFLKFPKSFIREWGVEFDIKDEALIYLVNNMEFSEDYDVFEASEIINVLSKEEFGEEELQDFVSKLSHDKAEAILNRSNLLNEVTRKMVVYGIYESKPYMREEALSEIEIPVGRQIEDISGESLEEIEDEGFYRGYDERYETEREEEEQRRPLSIWEEFDREDQEGELEEEPSEESLYQQVEREDDETLRELRRFRNRGNRRRERRHTRKKQVQEVAEEARQSGARPEEISHWKDEVPVGAELEEKDWDGDIHQY